MTPRDALQNLIEMIGMTMPMTVRDDNLTQKQIQLRNSVRCLRELIEKSDPTEYLPDSVESDFVHNGKKTDPDVLIRPRESVRGDGKDRLDTWKKEAGH